MDGINAACLIDGQWIEAGDGANEVRNPATDEVIARVPRLGAEEVGRAIGAAAGALPGWRRCTAAERGAVVGRLASLMRRDSERLARLMTLEQGKPLSESRGEIEYAASFLEWAGEEAKRVYGDVVPASKAGKRILVFRQPVGVVGIVTPWNFPAAMITRKLGPALACGCTAVIKPAEATPLSAIAICELAVEAGAPAGAVNLVTGEASDIAEPMLADERLRKLSFTGSTKVGRLLMKQAAQNVLRLSLELGGHAPFIVFEDADLDAAAEAAVACKFRNAGQTCICANRFYVHERVHDEFVGRFVERARRLRVGNGVDEGVAIGPLISDAGMEKVEAHVADAREKGGEVVLGGERVSVEGCADRFYAPTVITGMTREMALSREETFGPVAPFASFADEAAAVGLANDTEYGLAAYFFTRDASRLVRVAEALEYGIVGANDGLPSAAEAPFGGVKHSGVGREGGRYAMEEYTETKYVSWGVGE